LPRQRTLVSTFAGRRLCNRFIAPSGPLRLRARRRKALARLRAPIQPRLSLLSCRRPRKTTRISRGPSTRHRGSGAP
jgi:hypothetical protein